MKVTTGIVIIISFLYLTACESTGVKQSHQNETKAMRHGWVVFSGPKPTEVFESNENSILRGKKLYAEFCLKCHGAKGKGDGI